MWTPATRPMTFSGFATAPGPEPLPGVLVEPLRFSLGGSGDPTVEKLRFTSRADETGAFDFTDLPVTVEVQTVTSSIPPYEEYEITRPDSLPNLAFRVFIESEVLAVDLTTSGSQYTDVFVEEPQAWWTTAHPDRINVPLAGSTPLEILATSEEALALVPLSGLPPVPGKEFHFLRVGRVIRDEIGEIGDPRVDYADRSGYFTSSNMWQWVPTEPSFFPGQVDAPFGRTLQIGGHLGATFLTPPLSEELFYHVDFSRYTGSLAAPFAPAGLADTKPILDPLFNKKYLLPHVVPPRGQWQTLHLGPFEGTITAVEPSHSPTLVGTKVMVYKRPGLPNPADEYWPFHDLMVIWNSRAAADELVVLTIEMYRKTGGTDDAPELTKLDMSSSVNDHLPLLIDNRAPVFKVTNWRTGYATFAPQSVGAIGAFGTCGNMPVLPGHVDGNECLIVDYSIEDGAGNPHPHVSSYNMWVEYSPRQVTGAPLSARVDLWGRGGHPPFGLALGYDDINGRHTRSVPPTPPTPPIYEVYNQESVLVPWQLDGWPPEPNGDPPSPCRAYGAEVSLGCHVRTVNGWGRLFGHRHVSRHIIIER